MNPPAPWYVNPMFLTPLVAFIGVLVGGFISSFGGWLVAKGNRSHEFEKERRRRKQDCLEGVMESLDDAQVAIDEFCVSSSTQKSFAKKKPEDCTDEEYQGLLAKCAGDTVEHSQKASIALHTLQHYHTKLTVFGFEKCAKIIGDYYKDAISLKVLVNEYKDGKKSVDEYLSSRGNLNNVADRLRTSFSSAFDTL